MGEDAGPESEEGGGAPEKGFADEVLRGSGSRGCDEAVGGRIGLSSVGGWGVGENIPFEGCGPRRGRSRMQRCMQWRYGDRI